MGHKYELLAKMEKNNQNGIHWKEDFYESR